MPKYTRTETVEAWQWNGPEDNRGVVKLYDRPPRPDDPDEGIPKEYCLRWDGTFIRSPSDWIIKHGDKYKVISNAEFKAQGWKEIE